MELDRCALIQENDQLAVEIEFTGEPLGEAIIPDNESPYITLRVYLDPRTTPRLPEAAEEALTHVRGVISAEIRRLEALREGR